MSRYLISTAVAYGFCTRCKLPILRGLAEGMPARVDVRPVDRGAEVAAILTGRETFALTRHTRELVHRDAGRIRGGILGAGVYVAHRCGEVAPWPTA